MSRDFKYDIRPEAYAVIKGYIEIRMELGYFSNACTVRIAMDRARMNTAIRTFEMYAIQGVNMEVFVLLRISRVFVLMISRFL